MNQLLSVVVNVIYKLLILQEFGERNKSSITIDMTFMSVVFLVQYTEQSIIQSLEEREREREKYFLHREEELANEWSEGRRQARVPRNVGCDHTRVHQRHKELGSDCVVERAYLWFNRSQFHSISSKTELGLGISFVPTIVVLIHVHKIIIHFFDADVIDGEGRREAQDGVRTLSRRNNGTGRELLQLRQKLFGEANRWKVIDLEVEFLVVLTLCVLSDHRDAWAMKSVPEEHTCVVHQHIHLLIQEQILWNEGVDGVVRGELQVDVLGEKSSAPSQRRKRYTEMLELPVSSVILAQVSMHFWTDLHAIKGSSMRIEIEQLERIKAYW